MNRQIEPIENCLDGKPCLHLFAPGRVSPVCIVAGEGIFDLPGCPVGKWIMVPGMPDASVSLSYNKPKSVKRAAGDCENCPAAAIWKWGKYANQGLLCFYHAYYLGKPGKPISCSKVRKKCPERK